MKADPTPVKPKRVIKRSTGRLKKTGRPVAQAQLSDDHDHTDESLDELSDFEININLDSSFKNQSNQQSHKRGRDNTALKDDLPLKLPKNVAYIPTDRFI